MTSITNTAATGFLNAQSRLAAAGAEIAKGPQSGGSLAEQMVEIRTAKTEASANAAVLRTANEMNGRLLDILA